MSIDSASVDQRWREIRNNPETSLELNASSVARFMKRRESYLVREKIKDTLVQLANFRLESDGFKNDDPPGTGDLVTCEGLETFLVPAVEGVLPFSQFLAEYSETEKFSAAFAADISKLLRTWEDKGFPGEPYINSANVKKCIKASIRDRFKQINITESAAMACRTIIHLLTLHLNKGESETKFNSMIGSKIGPNVERLFDILTKAIDFLVDAYQKGDEKGNPIGSSGCHGKSGTGSGWSWTNYQSLPPLLFFTSSAVDAFAELDLYLIRPAQMKQINQKLYDYYLSIEKSLKQFEFCVDMARRWVKNFILNDISLRLGFYYEKDDDIEIEYLEKYREDEQIQDTILNDIAQIDGIERRKNEFHKPIVLYNNLYALVIILWSYSDYDDSGRGLDFQMKAKIERALLQLVANYRNNRVIQDVLDRDPFLFCLPGKDIFDEAADKENMIYMDSGFLTLLTRQLILYGAYGVGDRIVIDPLIRSLFVDLLLRRHREDPEYSYLWSTNSREVFATFRAVQALTFYTPYLEGVEMASGGGTFSGEYLSFYEGLLRELRKRKSTDGNGQSSKRAADDEQGERKDQDEVIESSFDKYFKKTAKTGIATGADDSQRRFVSRIRKTGQRILDYYHNRKIDSPEIEDFLKPCVQLLSNPWDENGQMFHAKYVDIINAVEIKVRQIPEKGFGDYYWRKVGQELRKFDEITFNEIEKALIGKMKSVGDKLIMVHHDGRIEYNDVKERLDVFVNLAKTEWSDEIREALTNTIRDIERQYKEILGDAVKNQ